MTDAELIEKLKGITGTTEDGELINMVLYDRMITADNETTHGVYVQINLDNYVTAVDSDAFIPDLSNWIKVDEGRGELYKYARVNYCPAGLYVDGFYNYKLVNGVVVYAPQIEPAKDHNELAPTEDLFVASRKYNVGELVSVQGRLYEVISIILAGGTINPGSNVSEITLEEYINKRVEETA